MTNYDRIKAMTVEEMAEWLRECDFEPPHTQCHYCEDDQSCSSCIETYLQQEMEAE